MNERDEALRRTLGDLRSEVGLIRRQAAEELGKLADARAVAALIATMARDTESEVRSAAAAALQAIRERGDRDDPVEQTDRWSARVLSTASSQEGKRKRPLEKTRRLKKGLVEEERGPIRSSAAENARALDATRQRSAREAALLRRQLLDEALASMPSIVIEEKRYGFKLTVPLLDGRRQFVRVGYEQSDFESDKVIVVFSPCGLATEDRLRWALVLNHGLSYGKLGIVAGPKGDEFVMSATLLEATADPAELRKAILSVAEKGDKVEQQLSSEDRF